MTTMTTHSSFLAWRIPMDRGAWPATVHKESDTTEVTGHITKFTSNSLPKI